MNAFVDTVCYARHHGNLCRADTSPLLPAPAITLPQPRQLTGRMLSEDKPKLMRQCAVVLGSVLLVFLHGLLLKRWLQLIT